MVFLIVDLERKLKPMLIKADTPEEAKDSIILHETQYIAGYFSDIDLQNLINCRCVVISY